MTFPRLVSTLGLLMVALVTGCPERRGPDVRLDSGPPSSDSGWDARAINRYRSGGGCHLIGCSGSSLRIVVANFYARFSDQPRMLDVEVCHAGACDMQKVELRDVDGGARGRDLELSLPDGRPNPPGVVRLKVSVPSGSTLLQEETMAEEDLYCPNGFDCDPKCPIRRAFFGTPTDAGQPADADPDPWREPIDRTCKAP